MPRNNLGITGHSQDAKRQCPGAVKPCHLADLPTIKLRIAVRDKDIAGRAVLREREPYRLLKNGGPWLPIVTEGSASPPDTSNLLVLLQRY